MSLSQYIGIPYKDHGRSRNGLDCWGLLWLIYQEIFDIDLPKLTGMYLSAEEHDDISQIIQKEIDARKPWIEVEAPDFGDAIVFAFIGNPWHIGMITSPGMMIHVMKGIDVCLERFKSPMWKNRLVGIYRHEDLA